ncbi:ribosomal protein S6 modification protein [Legionella geestiana]|uniref:Ribosomal protein S6 modification protein n=1 Tax=Legionella geestiana TaxID=45065 RepID=A0A0W0UAI4_9GAMM|nr:RimK family protein [Legionella geestiana]KTD04843.1 ribosomal protein S6 modification protein [Legionella geestiana]QBS11329.1 ATP-grasp domain-containing protein [Legionella geestiana]QDQ41023.1 RimK family protein [Legionella geestiana]STX54031.1 Glutathione synthase/Ribosomal protein S6 modification enzyme (glutaminyl transferase) [Legionella geestiana]
MQTIIVTDSPESWEFLGTDITIAHASDYLTGNTFSETAAFRVVNLCKSCSHQSVGYYVSLLAEARDHKAVPTVDTIQDILSTSLSRVISQDIDEEIQNSLNDLRTDTFVLSVYFGQNMAKCHANLAKKLHGLFPAPLMRFTMEKRKRWQITQWQILSIDDVPEHHRDFLQEAALAWLSRKRFYLQRKKQRFHDLAILIEPGEADAPSNAKALERFADAGESLGLNVDFIEKNDFKSIAEYDALFIRATTSVNHFTYRMARTAARENLVVVDDPQSIIKCGNKVYLAELLKSHQIKTPETRFISKFDKELPALSFPCVLKKPDSAFSRGVVKIEDTKALQKALNQFFKTSDLVLVQPFIPTEYDWRIGVLDNKPLFACRYFMAQNHWQIYNWAVDGGAGGNSEAIALADVPHDVMRAAVKSSKLIGDGFYGIDIKQHNGQCHVIEINDNPSIDYGVEDELLGDALYKEVMQYFLERIRRKHGYA